MSDHERIWLQPPCCADAYNGRVWCQDPDPEDCPDGVPWTEYVRADLLAAAEKRIAELVSLASPGQFDDKPHLLFSALIRLAQSRGVDPSAMAEMYERIGPMLKAEARIAELEGDVAHWRECFTALQREIVGDTGLSAMQEVRRMKRALSMSKPSDPYIAGPVAEDKP